MSAASLLTSEILSGVPGVRHGFTTREGGASAGHYRSLNLSPFSGDDLNRVMENRGRVAEALGASRLVTLRQVHSAVVHDADTIFEDVPELEGDGMVCSQPGVAVAALGADCAPVLFADGVRGVVGVAHGGWKGALHGVTDAVVERMVGGGSSVADIHAAIGPAIQVESYEVGEVFRAGFLDKSPVDASDCFREIGGRVHFDLPRYLEKRLQGQGLGAVERLEHDTYADEGRFFSYRRTCHRREHGYGRQVGAICITDHNG